LDIVAAKPATTVVGRYCFFVGAGSAAITSQPEEILSLPEAASKIIQQNIQNTFTVRLLVANFFLRIYGNRTC